MVVVFGKVHLATGKRGTKSHSRVARSLTAIAATLRVRDGLKMSAVVGGVDMGSEIGGRLLTSTGKCLERGSDGGK